MQEFDAQLEYSIDEYYNIIGQPPKKLKNLTFKFSYNYVIERPAREYLP